MSLAIKKKRDRHSEADLQSQSLLCYKFYATYVHFVGPIAAGLSNALGCRVVAILGSVLAAAGLALSASASTISQLYFTAGCMTGIGFGFIYLPAACTISFYFEKKRAFATGIAVCGSGMGGFILGKQVDSFFVEIRRSFRAN